MSPKTVEVHAGKWVITKQEKQRLAKAADKIRDARYKTNWMKHEANFIDYEANCMEGDLLDSLDIDHFDVDSKVVVEAILRQRGLGSAATDLGLFNLDDPRSLHEQGFELKPIG